MTIPIKAWIMLCAVIMWSGVWWCGGYHTADAAWTAKDTERKLADAKAAKDLSEQYRAKEQKLNETIGDIETKAINDAADAEAEYKSVIDRLRNAGNHPVDGLRVKPALTCGRVQKNPATSSNGDAEVQGGVSPELAERIIGVGAECDKVVYSLQACQEYTGNISK